MKVSIGAKALLIPTPVLAVGTYDDEGRPNVMTAAWGGICCSQPPCLAVSLRSATYTHGNIVRRRAFTVSVPSIDHVREADYFGIVSGARGDKWAATGLHPIAGEQVDAPYVAEFPLVLECRLLHTLELGLHTQFVGEILDVRVEQACLREGKLDPEALRAFIYVPDAGAYYAVGDTLGKAFTVGRKLQPEGSAE